jgi:hypothetical protein
MSASMLDALTIISGFAGAVIALCVAVLAFVRLRAERSSEWQRRGQGSEWFARLSRPLPLLFGALLLALVSGLLLSTLGDDEQPEADATAVPLLRQMVDEDAQGCAEARATDGAVAALTCTFSDRPMRTLRISLFPSDEALRAAERQKLDATGVRKAKCGSRRIGWENWRHGILICDYGQRGFPPNLQWSRRDSRVLVQAQARPGTNARQVYDWWLKESNGAPANNREPYPDRREQEVLRRTRLARDACDRVSTFKGSSAGLRCSATGVTYLFIGYYDTRDALSQALGDPPGEGSCVPIEEGPEPGRARYRIGESVAGTRDCHSLTNEGASVMEWTNESTKLYGYATTTGSSGADLERIFAWWEETGQFLTD